MATCAHVGEVCLRLNSGHNTIAIFLVDDATGKLALAAWEPTQARQPRFFALSPDGGLLYAANQGSDIIVAFRGDRQGRRPHAKRSDCRDR
jgi:6-phosphogluconolactonase (cycloisomerase 2 family)